MTPETLEQLALKHAYTEKPWWPKLRDGSNAAISIESASLATQVAHSSFLAGAATVAEKYRALEEALDRAENSWNEFESLSLEERFRACAEIFDAMFDKSAELRKLRGES